MMENALDLSRSESFDGIARTAPWPSRASAGSAVLAVGTGREVPVPAPGDDSGPGAGRVRRAWLLATSGDPELICLAHLLAHMNR